MSYDLTIKADREALAERVRLDIETWSEKEFAQGHRKHLGASQLGEKCWRKLYYIFRWVKLEKHEGRVLRLFQVGHDAEPRFIRYLTGIGFQVSEHDPVTGKQYRINGAKDHYGGSLDGKCKPPVHYNIQGDLILLNEFKTNKAEAAYTKLAYTDLQECKPQHWAQMCQYGYKEQIKYGIYLIENKDDSDITIKIVELDWNLGASLERKAEEIIFAKEPPQRVSENPSFFNCKYCFAKKICHDGEAPEKNCRSCRSASPVENGQWHCSRYDAQIPDDWIKVGCDNWNAI